MMQSFKETNNRRDKVSFCNFWGVQWSNTSNKKLIPNIFGNMWGFWFCLNLNGEGRDYISATVCLVTLLTAMRTAMGIQCQEPHSSGLTGIMCVLSAKSLQLHPTRRPHRLQLVRPLCPWDPPGKNTGMGCHALLQGLFLTRGLNLRLLHLLSRQVGSLPLVSLGHNVTNTKELSLPSF